MILCIKKCKIITIYVDKYVIEKKRINIFGRDVCIIVFSVVFVFKRKDCKM